MIFSNINITISTLSIFGFLIALYVRSHKTKNIHLMCIKGFECEAVVHSDYSRFLGMPNELLGMIYYAGIFIFSLILIFLPSVIPHTLSLCVVSVSLLAFIFSFYLLSVQLFILKKGCLWCILSSIFSALIFVLIVSM